MARVVQRSSPPYLLILFIFLFFIAFALSVLFYMQTGDLKKEVAELKDVRDKLISETERQQDAIKAMMAKAGPTVVEQQRKRVGELANIIAGTFDYDNAKAMAERVSSIVGTRSMVAAVESLQATAKGQEDQITQLRSDLATATEQRQKGSDAVTDLQKQLEDKERKFTLELTAERQTVANIRKAYDDELKKAQQEFDRSREELVKEDVRKTGEIARLERELQKKQMAVEELRTKLASLRPKMDPGMVVRQADGRIERVLPERDIVYINLGSNDGVEPGLPFSVYPQSGMPKDPDDPGKATIEVRNVAPTFSECTIVKRHTKDPVVASDLVANIAFDKTRTYTFVVEGLFDLWGEGKATKTGAKEVEDAIRRAGGKISDSLDYDVDFLVLGEEPLKPPQPDANNAVGMTVYEAQLKDFERYQKVKDQVRDYPVFVLNTNRFLAMTGYLPKKGPTVK